VARSRKASLKEKHKSGKMGRISEGGMPGGGFGGGAPGGGGAGPTVEEVD